MSDPRIEILAVCEVHGGCGHLVIRRTSASPSESSIGEALVVLFLELAAAIQRAEGCGFRFTRPRPGAAWWGERESAQWRDIVFLDLCGPSHACRGPRIPESTPCTDQVYGDALTVVRAVCGDWPIA